MARYVENLFRHWTRFAVILFLLPTPLIMSIPKSMHVTPSGSHLVTITFSCSKAAECTETLRATIAVFQSRLTEALKAQEQLSTSFLQSQVAAAQQKSNDSEAALQKYL